MKQGEASLYIRHSIQHWSDVRRTCNGIGGRGLQRQASTSIKSFPLVHMLITCTHHNYIIIGLPDLANSNSKAMQTKTHLKNHSVNQAQTCPKSLPIAFILGACVLKLSLTSFSLTCKLPTCSARSSDQPIYTQSIHSQAGKGPLAEVW